MIIENRSTIPVCSDWVLGGLVFKVPIWGACPFRSELPHAPLNTSLLQKRWINCMTSKSYLQYPLDKSCPCPFLAQAPLTVTGALLYLLTPLPYYCSGFSEDQCTISVLWNKDEKRWNLYGVFLHLRKRLSASELKLLKTAH